MTVGTVSVGADCVKRHLTEVVGDLQGIAVRNIEDGRRTDDLIGAVAGNVKRLKKCAVCKLLAGRIGDDDAFGFVHCIG